MLAEAEVDAGTSMGREGEMDRVVVLDAAVWTLLRVRPSSPSAGASFGFCNLLSVVDLPREEDFEVRDWEESWPVALSTDAVGETAVGLETGWRLTDSLRLSGLRVGTYESSLF